MKKLLLILVALTASFTLFGCDKNKDKPVSTNKNSIVENSEISATEQPTEPTLAERDRTVDTNKEFVFDDAKVLSSTEYKALNERTAWLSKTFKTNVSVVIADDIGEKSAKEYAEEYYKEIYGGSNGIMLLVNNDTGNDYILKKGAPSLFVENSDVEMLFSEISPMLVTGNYNEAIIKTLELFELNLPEYAIDHTNKMTREDILAVNEILSKACDENQGVSMIFVGDTGEKSVEEYAKEQAEKYIETDSDNIILVVNTQNGECGIVAQGRFADAEKNKEHISGFISGCIVENGDEKSFDYDASADIFVKFIGN